MVPALPAGKKMFFRTNLSPTKADFLGLMDEKGVTCPPPQLERRLRKGRICLSAFYTGRTRMALCNCSTAKI